LGLHPDEGPIVRWAEVFELMCHAKDYGLAADDVRIGADAFV
jgi:hypothetical protein